MIKKNLLSIGDLSKITGVHIKALRYYDSLGILPPTFVDPNSGYRYYSFEHKAIVDAIKFCVELDIPLKQFNNYTNTEEPWICYADLVKHGANVVEEKIKFMQELLSRLKVMQTEIERSEYSYRNENPQVYTLPARDCWIVPYDGKQMCEEYKQYTKKVIMQIHSQGLQLGNIGGLLLLPQEDEWKQYLFIDVRIPEKDLVAHPEILHIPSGKYLCKKVNNSNIQQAWDWCLPLMSKEQIRLIIETELFIGNYYFSAPVLEQRCLLY